MTKLYPISDPKKLVSEVNEVEHAKWIGIDTEFLREKTYYPVLCLVQVATPERFFCVDALAISDLGPLDRVLSNDKVTKVIHSCRQDLEVLELSTGVSIHQIYDTQIAASFCGYGEQVSYASLVKSVCGVDLPKSFTRTDWSKRPLSDEQLEYARDDVAYLGQIRATLDAELGKLGRVDWFEQECERVLQLRDYLVQPEDAWKRVKGLGKLPSHGQGVARALAAWREQTAKKRNLPREWILPTRTLLDISMARPSNSNGLARIESVNRGILRHSSDSILRVVHRYAKMSGQPVAVESRPILDRADRGRAREIMDWIRAFSERAGISQSLLANRSDVESFVSGNTDIPLFKGWRYEFVGKQVMAEFG